MKKNSKEVIASFLAIGMLASSGLTLTACGGGGNKVADDENTLEIFISDFGYGTAWLDDVIAKFKNEAWVKEKYPSLNIPKVKKNSEKTYPADSITSGTTTVDLFFSTMTAAASYEKTDASGKYYFEDITDVYNAEVPGETITVKDKMLPSILSGKQYVTKAGETKYYAVPWVNGYMGLLYNETLMKEYLGNDYAVPLTTNELVQMAKDIKAEGEVPFISAAKVDYWLYVFQTWWMQYEGATEYENYWNGQNKYGEYTSDIFSQQGRLEGLKVLESLISRSNGYNHTDSTTQEFTAAQSKMILGEAVMMPNGDWFETEMRSNYAEDKNHYDIKFMKTPIISSIVEKMDLYTHGTTKYTDLTESERNAYDAKLQAIITAVDNGTTDSLTGVSASDIQKIQDARKAIIGISSHDAMIPSYAKAKGVAKDFLRFLATDSACESFMRATNGASTAFNYDVKTKNPTLYNSFSNLQKERAEMALNGITSTASYHSKLAYWGGLNSFAMTEMLESAFMAQSNDDRKSATKIFQDDITYYTANSGENWENLLKLAGMKN